MTTAIPIVLAVLAISLLIVIHEAGHFLAARAFGMKVERFSVGFGPVILSARRGDTEFALSALPFGGYVRIAGMAPGDDVDPADGSAYANQPAWRRFVTILAGPAMNYVAAVILAAGLLATTGLPDPDPTARVGAPEPGKPAALAGLLDGDRILSVDGEPVGTWLELVSALQRRPGKTFPLEVERGGARLRLTITPASEGGQGRIYVHQHALVVRRGGGAAIAEAVGRTNVQIGAQLAGFASLFSSGKKPNVTGPVGIGKELVRGARQGAMPFLALVWTISVVLAILNLFPIPALDGGRLVFLAFEIVTRRRVNAKLENTVNLAGAVVLFALIVGVTLFKDLLGR